VLLNVPGEEGALLRVATYARGGGGVHLSREGGIVSRALLGRSQRGLEWGRHLSLAGSRASACCRRGIVETLEAPETAAKDAYDLLRKQTALCYARRGAARAGNRDRRPPVLPRSRANP